MGDENSDMDNDNIDENNPALNINFLDPEGNPVSEVIGDLDGNQVDGFVESSELHRFQQQLQLESEQYQQQIEMEQQKMKRKEAKTRTTRSPKKKKKTRPKPTTETEIQLTTENPYTESPSD